MYLDHTGQLEKLEDVSVLPIPIKIPQKIKNLWR
jgi:hypothetical protein